MYSTDRRALGVQSIDKPIRDGNAGGRARHGSRSLRLLSLPSSRRLECQYYALEVTDHGLSSRLHRGAVRHQWCAGPGPGCGFLEIKDQTQSGILMTYNVSKKQLEFEHQALAHRDLLYSYA